MTDELARDVAREGDQQRIRDLLADVCRITGMGFAAVARVTDERWIVAQVLDKIDFGLEPGDELDLKTTICTEIRESGRTVVIDHVQGDPAWRTHHTPVMYGFESYVSVPVVLAENRFYGTLCALDPLPRLLSVPSLIAALEGYAREISLLLADAGAAAPAGVTSGRPPHGRDVA